MRGRKGFYVTGECIRIEWSFVGCRAVERPSRFSCSLRGYLPGASLKERVLAKRRRSRVGGKGRGAKFER